MSSVKILIAGIVSIAIQFGLAIAGWDGWSAFFAHPALRALASWKQWRSCSSGFPGRRKAALL
jgi:hypothetical protein